MSRRKNTSALVKKMMRRRARRLFKQGFSSQQVNKATDPAWWLT